MHSYTLLSVLAFAYPALARYELKWDYNANNFWENFNFIDSPDTAFTSGFAQYVGQDEATASGLARIVDNKVHIGVDTNNTYDLGSTGRKIIRLQSWGSFDNGLLVADMAHVPVAGCGMWPAFWVYRGESATGYSEIDILENVNKASFNTHSFYTSEQCTVNIDAGESLRTNNCFYEKGMEGAGCSFQAAEGTFNQKFNDDKKIIALQVERDTIKIWHFGKDEVPADIEGGVPDPSQWMKPSMSISPQSCDFGKAFSQFHIIINITFCGGWAGGDDWNLQCAAETSTTCNNWVANNPDEFKDTYFEFNSIKLFQKTA